MNTSPNGNRAKSYNGAMMELGKKGETLVMEWLRSNSHVLGVDDYTDLKKMQKADVDCGIYMNDGRVLLAEIKTDKNLGKYKNIAFEVLRINHTPQPEYAGTLGWSLRTPATFLIMYAPEKHSIYKMRLRDLRAAFQAHSMRNRGLGKFRFVETDSIKSTLIYLVPESEIANLSIHKL